jgi:anti-anti-sigma factor
MEEDLLRIDTVATADRITVSLSGELDLSNAANLVERLAGVVQAQPARLDVDLSMLEYTDSVGLSVFVTAHFQCLDAGIALQFVNPNLFIQELLATTGLNQVFSIATTDALIEA